MTDTPGTDADLTPAATPAPTPGGAPAVGPPATPGTATGADVRRGPLRVGDRVQLTDPRGRLHTITLAPGATATHSFRITPIR